VLLFIVYSVGKHVVNWNKLQNNMSAVELKKRLIDKIQKTDNESILEEAYRLLELETEDI
jgi:hypothetical protein